MKILITGKNGYIAKQLIKQFSLFNQVISIGRQDCQLDNRNKVDLFFESFSNNQIDIVIHCASQGKRTYQDIQNKDILYKNILMFQNLCKNKIKFKKMFIFSSGAQFNCNGYPTQPYDLSKKIISNLSKDLEFVTVFNIWAIFNQNQLDGRYIKSCIINYINKKPIIINSNIKFDFFYMEDFIKLIKQSINGISFEKVINCCYDKQITLLQVAQFINNIDQYNVPIKLLNIQKDNYCSKIRSHISINNLFLGIKKCYQILNIQHNGE